MPLSIRTFFRVAAVAGLAVAPFVATTATASAATTGGGNQITLPIAATPLSTAGSLTIRLSPPDPCGPSAEGGFTCIDLVPGLVQVVAFPPDPIFPPDPV